MLFAGKNSHLYACIALALIIHGGVLFFTFTQTYDAYVHLFFAGHYAETWFETWNPKWYTGFTITSYPPLVHQSMALLSKIVGLKAAFMLWSMVVIVLFVRGAYHFSALFIPEKAMKYAGLMAVFSFSFTEALHVFGQLPSLTGVSLLLNACPFIYKWFRQKKARDLVTALSLLALTTCAHHVTTIFGMVFFVAPVIALALIDNTAAHYGLDKWKLSQFVRTVFKEIIPAGAFGVTVIVITVTVILPYWLWSKSDPITQIPIPHGSRENFIAEPNLGIVFFLIPWGMMLFALPYIFQKLYTRRLIFFGLSFTLLFILGTGGTTPIPEMLLGSNAFNILTLDRFTFWATVMALPMWGWLIYDLVEGDLYMYWVEKGKAWVVRGMALFLLAGTLLLTGLTINLSNFKPMQPEQLDMVPIVNFLERDNHYKWRYLTLGFGDQVAWLSANTKAQTVDGNYHSVRRLPELTSRAVERLENSKYLGMEGLGSLQQFLTIPQYFYLKYIFANDKFYDPILYFSGWQRIGNLENDIVVWERPDVPFLPELLPRKDIPRIQKWIWGVTPLTVLSAAVFIYIILFRFNGIPFYCPRKDILPPAIFRTGTLPRITVLWCGGLLLFVVCLFTLQAYRNHDQVTPENTVRTYFDAMDFKNFPHAYSLFEPGSYPGFEQYVLELSLTDGILASYAKLDNLVLDLTHKEKNTATIQAHAQWITSLETYSSKHEFELVRRGPLWYILPFPKDRKVPAESFHRKTEVTYKSQGRRSVEVRSNEDILDRPEVVLEEAHLLSSKNSHHVIGTITNTDADPAHVTLQAVVYDSLGREIGRYGLRDVGVHALQPGESTPFRIDFERDGWAQSSLRIQRDTALLTPASFALFANTVVTDEELYRQYGLEEIRCEENGMVSASLYNYGAREITVPQVLVARKQGAQLQWVERHYLERGVRSGRKLFFRQTLDGIPVIEARTTAPPSALIVNGKSMEETGQHGNSPDTFHVTCDDELIFFKVNAFVNEINR